MELKPPPECFCGNGLMLLKEAGDFSSRPGHRYCICPVGQKHRNRFFWYDDYYGVYDNLGKEQSVEMGSNFKYSQDGSCHGSKTMHRTRYMNNSTSTPFLPKKHGDSYDPNSDTASKRDLTSATYGFSADGFDSKPFRRDHVCCCFGFMCAMLCVLALLVLILVGKMW